MRTEPLILVVRSMAVRRCVRGMLIALTLTIASAAGAVDLEGQIDQAERLGLSDPAAAIEQLQTIEQNRQDVTVDQLNRIRLIELRLRSVLGDTDRGLAQAIALSNQIDNPLQRTSALRLAANLALNDGQFELAFAQLSEALDLLDEVDSPKNAVGVFGLASFFHSRSGDTLLAVDYAMQSLQSAEQSGDERLQCAALGWLANAYLAQQERERARGLGERARQHCQSAQDPITQAWIENLMAWVALDQGRFDDARQHLAQARALNVDQYWEVQIENALISARLDLLEGRLSVALEQFTDLSEALRDDRRGDRLTRALDGAAEAATQLGDMPTALDFHKRRVEARQLHRERTRSLRMTQLSMAFDRDRSEQEIALLREQERVIELRQRSRVQERWLRHLAGALGLIVVLLLLFGLWRASRERRHYRQLSDRDSLTGLFNHTRFFKQLNQELTQPQTLALVLADIDHFKQVNDRFGHQIGDEVLRQTARVLREVFGADQLIGRIGGEEFGIRLLGADQTVALGAVEQLRERLAGQARRRTDPPITLSFGVSVARPGESLEALRQRTDQALYLAKAQGRNCVVAAD